MPHRTRRGDRGPGRRTFPVRGSVPAISPGNYQGYMESDGVTPVLAANRAIAKIQDRTGSMSDYADVRDGISPTRENNYEFAQTFETNDGTTIEVLGRVIKAPYSTGRTNDSGQPITGSVWRAEAYYEIGDERIEEIVHQK